MYIYIYTYIYIYVLFQYSFLYPPLGSTFFSTPLVLFSLSYRGGFGFCFTL